MRMYPTLRLPNHICQPVCEKAGKLSKSSLQLRTLTAADWDLVRHIYLDGIATGQATFETEAPTWERWNEVHLPAPRLVAISDEPVVGWAALSSVSARSVYTGVADVSVYVAADWHGQGIGRVLLEKILSESEENDIWTLQASIFPENGASVSLHKACGFREVGTRERIGKMKGVWRNTILLERRSKRVGRN